VCDGARSYGGLNREQSSDAVWVSSQISPQVVTPLLLGMDFCMDNHVVIDFPKKTIVINADEQESATKVDLVNERRNTDISIDSPVTRAINLGTADLPPTPQLDLS